MFISGCKDTKKILMYCIEFLKFCLDDNKIKPVSANDIDWKKLLFWAEQQAIVGVVFGGIQKAGKSLGIPTDVLFKWIGYVNQKATTAVKKNILRIKRDLRMMRYFPSECLWEPVFRVYHWMWRLRYY